VNIMLCQICHAQEATIYFVETVGDKSTSLRICEACAQKKHLGDAVAKPAQAIHELLASILQLGASPSENAPDLQCPQCGLRFSQFREAGRLGCAKCYEAFQSALLPLLRQFHQAEEHRGRAAAQAGDPAGLNLEALKAQIRAAVAEDNFELAAELRDKIKAVEGKKPA
jgi:protein arginine kinase activator